MRISIEDALHGVIGVSARTVSLLAWTLVLSAHACLLGLALLALWWWQVTPQAAAQAVRSAVPAPLATTLDGTLAFLGLSAAGVLLAYAKAWQWLAQRLASRFVLDFE